MHLIPAFLFFSKSGFVSGSMSLFTSTNQIYSSCNIRREFAFFQTLFLQGSRCAGQHGIIEEIHRDESKLLLCQLLSKKKLDAKSDKCRPHSQLILPG
jgi:hypothetical protein